MPNQEIMREWTNRLRSGDYKQGQGRLRRGDYYCCLGVLCEIAAEQGVIAEPTVLPISTQPLVDRANLYQYQGNIHMPPRAVYDWAGIPAGGADEEPPGAVTAKNLADRNDAGNTFTEIAYMIEAEWIDPPAIPDNPATLTNNLVNA